MDVRASLGAAGGRTKMGNRRALNKNHSISILMAPLYETEDARIKSTCGLQGTVSTQSVFSELCSKHHQTVFLQGFKFLWSGSFTKQPKISK